MTTAFVDRFVCSVAVAALLAGCSSTAQSTLSPLQSPSQATQLFRGASPSRKPAVGLGDPSTGNSWISVAAKGAPALMYVSEQGSRTVNVYNYNGGKNPSLMGTLTGFKFPAPGCTDNKGNVFIADIDRKTITEYAYGSSKPTQVLSDKGNFSFGCSVDPTTGNLAVANFASGSVSIYTAAKGKPKVIAVPGNALVEFVAYDDKGDLFAAGRDSFGGPYVLDEMLSGKSAFSGLTVSGGSITYPAQLQWNGTYLLAGDQGIEGNTSSINEIRISGSTAKIVKNIPLVGSSDVVAGYEWGSGASATFAAPDYEANAGDIYSFPEGSKTSSFSGSNEPYGAVVVRKGP